MAIGAAIGLLLGAGLLWQQEVRNAIPARLALQDIQGHLVWIQSDARSVSFRLEESGLTFIYPKKSGDIERLWSLLATSRGQRIRVSYRPVSAGARPQAQVWGLEIGNLAVRSYDDIATRWAQDDWLGLPLGIACIIAGVGLGEGARRRYRALA
ncbi:MAG: hypothetical protein GAK43_02161 [Stenotrophomonas maltophilia]|nr:MAG: hypothetical protein GAK43_02161 [Stenotrophomonas maltophilia]